MGIASCSPKKVIWLAENLALSSLNHLDVGNRIDVDVNALAWKLAGKGNTIHDVIHSMAVLLKGIAQSGGFIVTVVIDGNGRPDYKRDSWIRKKQRDLDDMNRMYCRLKSLELSAKSESGKMSTQERADLELYEKEALSLEKSCQRSLIIPKDFGQRLSERLMMMNACAANENGGFVQERILEAKFQADSVIARRFIANKSDFILADDTDFIALVGPECILINSIEQKQSTKRGRKRKNASQNETSTRCPTSFKVKIVGACNEKMKSLQQKIQESDSTAAKYPLFSYPDPSLRGLIALALGSDVFKGCVKDYGPTTNFKDIEAILKSNNEENTVEAFKKIVEKKSGVEPKIIQILSDAF